MKTQWISLSILYSMCFVGLFQKGHEVVTVGLLGEQTQENTSFLCAASLYS